MGSKRVTKRSVDALRCPAGKDRVFLWDDSLSGFGVVAFPKRKDGDTERTKKVYIIQFRQKGRSRRMKIGEYGRLTPDQARSAAKKLLGAIEQGGDPIAERRGERNAKTFAQVADEFLKLHAEAKRKARTASEYKNILNLRLLPELGSRILSGIRKVDISRLHTKFADTPGAANRTVALFSAIWNWAARRDEVSEAANPARGIERYSEKGRERFLSMAELGRLGDALRRAEMVGLPWLVDAEKTTTKHTPKKNRLTKLDLHAVAAIRLLILAGARLHEILDARWDYVDWDRGLMHLPDSKTGKKTIYLSAAALMVLQGLSRRAGNPFLITGMTPDKAEKGVKGKREPKPRADLKKPWAAVSRAAGLKGVRLHDLRHSFAATGAGASLGLPMIGKLLGHSPPATTARYAHLDADPMHRAANLIGDQISAAMNGNPGKVVRFKPKTAS